MTDDAGWIEYVCLNRGQGRGKRHIAALAQRSPADIETFTAAGRAANDDAVQK